MVSDDKKNQPKIQVVEDPNIVINQLQAFMAQCTQLLDDGEIVDLSGLDEQVADLCQAIAEMDFDEADRLRPKLDSVVAGLGALGGTLGKKKEELSQQLGSLNDQKQAYSAYQRASVSGAATVTDQMPHRPDDETHDG